MQRRQRKRNGRRSRCAERGASTVRRRRERQRKKSRGGWKVSREVMGTADEDKRIVVEVLSRKEKTFQSSTNPRQRVEYLRRQREKSVRSERAKPESEDWQEERVRVGTGYRVKPEKVTQESKRVVAGDKRVRELGYSHKKELTRPRGVEVEVSKNNMGRRVRARGKGCRERVISVVCERERMRPWSIYTGCGVMRKEMVGKRKRKSTKGRAAK